MDSMNERAFQLVLNRGFELFGTTEIMQLDLIALHTLVETLPRTLVGLFLEALAAHLERDGLPKDDSPDAAFNIAVSASRVDRHDIERRLLAAFLHKWPNQVDLLCQKLQLCYGVSVDEAEADAVWRRLAEAPNRGRYWRYWCYGARYHIRLKNDTKGAIELLKKGLEEVPHDEKNNVAIIYADILADDHVSNDKTTTAVAEAIALLETNIRQGYDNGYRLAHKLGVLHQRLAASADTKEERLKCLETALDWLERAEAAFTNDRRHPIKEIYRDRVNVLMGLERYQPAVHDLISLVATEPKSRHETSLMSQLVSACQRAGKPDDLWKPYVKQEGSEDEE